MDPYFQQFGYEHQFSQNQQDIYNPAPINYSQNWDNSSTQYPQNQYISEQYGYSQTEQQHRYDSFSNTYSNNWMNQSKFMNDNVHHFIPEQHYQHAVPNNFQHNFQQPYQQSFACQPSQQFNYHEIPQCQQNYLPYSSEQQTPCYPNSPNLSELEEMMKQLLQQQQYQLRTNERLKNCQMLLDQMQSSFNQMLAQRSNDIPSADVIDEKMDCSINDNPDFVSSTTHDSSKSLYDDVVVDNDVSSEDNILVDSVETSSLDVAEDVSVGGCSLEASSLESPFDLSVGDCMEAIPQESLPLVIESSELEQEPSSVEEDKIVESHDLQLGLIYNQFNTCNASDTSYSSMISINDHHSKIFIEVSLFVYVGCDLFLHAYPTQFDIISSALSYPTCVWEMYSFFGLADFFDSPDCPLLLNKAPTSQVTIEFQKWITRFRRRLKI